MKKMLRSKKGFSLVELLIVLTIIAVIAALAINVFGNVSEKSKIKADTAQAENIKKAVVAYMTETEDVELAYLKTVGTNPKTLGSSLSKPISGTSINGVTKNESITGKTFGPYMSLTGDLPNPKQAGGKMRWKIDYYVDTQNIKVTMVDNGAQGADTFTVTATEPTT